MRYRGTANWTPKAIQILLQIEPPTMAKSQPIVRKENETSACDGARAARAKRPLRYLPSGFGRHK